jgi:acyl-CoA synthetase (AMP-forming)/AMP-acid ligase II/acyl carrier protein
MSDGFKPADDLPNGGPRERRSGFDHGGMTIAIVDARQGRSMPEQLGGLAQRYRERVALSGPPDDTLTYERLHEQIRALVSALNRHGIGRGDRVALVLPDGLALALSFLGLSAGATCAPLNPALRAAEFESIFDDLAPKALVVEAGADSAAVGAARARSIAILELTWVGANGWRTLVLHGETCGTPARPGLAGGADVALLLFTSGTTAKPKLVPLTHVNLLASAYNIASTLRLRPDDRCLNIMPLFHIHGLIGGLLASLVSGGSVVCPPKFAIEDFFKWLMQFKPTWYSAVPAMHQAILAEAQAHGETVRRFPLRLIRSSSSALPTRVMAELEAAFGAPVLESYGMTEASHQIASNPLPPARRKPGSVGKAAGPGVAVLDDNGKFCLTGTVGEVVIRGTNVTDGYCDNHAANANAFTAGWFRTGDQGYLDEEGYLFLTGRIKELINRGGEKISPREVDEVLLAHPAVEQAATFAVPHPTLGEEVAAAVVLRRGMQATVAELGEFAAGRMTDFKTPKRILIVDEIPKSATGKLQRASLAEKFTGLLQGDTVEPETHLESMIAQIYAEVLGVESVGTTDNFFALGGDSLRATQVISRVRAMFDLNLSIATVFRKPTVAELAAEIVGAMTDSDGDATTA